MNFLLDVNVGGSVARWLNDVQDMISPRSVGKTQK